MVKRARLLCHKTQKKNNRTECLYKMNSTIKSDKRHKKYNKTHKKYNRTECMYKINSTIKRDAVKGSRVEDEIAHLGHQHFLSPCLQLTNLCLYKLE